MYHLTFDQSRERMRERKKKSSRMSKSKQSLGMKMYQLPLLKIKQAKE